MWNLWKILAFYFLKLLYTVYDFIYGYSQPNNLYNLFKFKYFDTRGGGRGGVTLKIQSDVSFKIVQYPSIRAIWKPSRAWLIFKVILEFQRNPGWHNAFMFTCIAWVRSWSCTDTSSSSFLSLRLYSFSSLAFSLSLCSLDSLTERVLMTDIRRPLWNKHFVLLVCSNLITLLYSIWTDTTSRWTHYQHWQL